MSEQTRIIFGAIYRSGGIELIHEFFLKEYNLFVRPKIQKLMKSISLEIIKRTERSVFQAIIDADDYLENNLPFQNNKVLREIKKYQVYVYAPENSILSYLLITTRNYRGPIVYRIFLYLDKIFRSRYPDIVNVERDKIDFPEFKEKIKNCQDQDKVDKIAEIMAESNEVKNIMIKNIQDILERGEKLEDLLNQTDDILINSEKFYKNSRKMNRCCILL